MIITRETDYALRILSALSQGGVITTGELCEREDVPKQFAYKIIKKLSAAGVVETIRGTVGGCRLTADLKQMSLLDLLKITGSDYLVTACMRPEYECVRRKKLGGRCEVHCHLAVVQAHLDQELRAFSVQQVLCGEG